jgi:hypothetical protein
MTISCERLHQAVCELHARAEDLHRQDGVAQMMLLLIPATGPGTLYILPEGIPSIEVLAALVRQASAVGIALAGAVWESAPGISGPTLLGMPFADMPQPSTDPNRAEAILTYAVGIGADDTTIVLTRASRIQRTGFGTMISDPEDDVPSIRRDGATTALAAALHPTTDQPRSRPEPTVTSKDTAMHSPATPNTRPAPHSDPGPADLSDCPDCGAHVGMLHAQTCCIG